MSKRKEQGLTTRQHIIEVARDLFAAHGYENTSIGMVLSASGISRGALYHHFEGKQALFDVVLDQVESELAANILASAERSRDPVASLRAGCVQFLRFAQDPVVRQIVLIDAPNAVGWQRWREIDARHGFGLMKFSLAAAAGSGKVDRDLAEVYAHAILASVMELALLVARSDDPDTELAHAERAIEVMIDGIRQQ
ncbi:MAG: TetR/AcrR family transcriptional regulator [Pseudomonadales bacterium]|nr:TetR/AcrR family transcriptional regulator [Pseudomonadales bacterium]